MTSCKISKSGPAPGLPEERNLRPKVLNQFKIYLPCSALTLTGILTVSFINFSSLASILAHEITKIAFAFQLCKY